MAKILGVQSTGTPHLGNLLGAIIPAIALSINPKTNPFFSLLIYTR
jgi:tryptophanyl-tRNA synthetase